MIRINLLGDTLAQTASKKGDKAEAAQVYAQGEGSGRSSFPIAGLIVGLVCASFGLVYYLMLDREVRQAQEEVTKLEQEKRDLEKYTALEKKFREDKEALQKKKEVMLGLKTAQQLPVRLLEELANTVPDDVWFKEITQKGTGITIKGESSSFEAINLFRSKLNEQTKWFGNVNYPKADKKVGVVEFTISFDLKNQS